MKVVAFGLERILIDISNPRGIPQCPPVRNERWTNSFNMRSVFRHDRSMQLHAVFPPRRVLQLVICSPCGIVYVELPRLSARS